VHYILYELRARYIESPQHSSTLLSRGWEHEFDGVKRDLCGTRLAFCVPPDLDFGMLIVCVDGANDLAFSP
jgi:hypothetical protein